jgi:hypothetical protein
MSSRDAQVVRAQIDATGDRLDRGDLTALAALYHQMAMITSRVAEHMAWASPHASLAARATNVDSVVKTPPPSRKLEVGSTNGHC